MSIGQPHRASARGVPRSAPRSNPRLGGSNTCLAPYFNILTFSDAVCCSSQLASSSVAHPGPNAAGNALLVTDGDVDTRFVHSILFWYGIPCSQLDLQLFRKQTQPYRHAVSLGNTCNTPLEHSRTPLVNTPSSTPSSTPLLNAVEPDKLPSSAHGEKSRRSQRGETDTKRGKKSSSSGFNE